MKYIQIDNFNGNINIVQEEGKVVIFDSLIEAKNSLNENCQNGFIVPLNVDIFKTLIECEHFISKITYEEGIENFEYMGELINDLESLLGYKN